MPFDPDLTDDVTAHTERKDGTLHVLLVDEIDDETLDEYAVTRTQRLPTVVYPRTSKTNWSRPHSSKPSELRFRKCLTHSLRRSSPSTPTGTCRRRR